VKIDKLGLSRAIWRGSSMSFSLKKMIRKTYGLKACAIAVAAFCLVTAPACAPRIVQVSPTEGTPATVVNVSMEYLVDWPRVQISDVIMDWPHLKLLAADTTRKEVPGEELIWIEDKVLQFSIPDLAPGDYEVIIHDDKGPPGDLIYSFLETTAYVFFPPVWPFVFRSNQAYFQLRVLPKH